MVLSLIRSTHLSTSLLGPLLLSHTSLRIGAFLHIPSIYSNNTLDCLKAAPTMTTFLLGSNRDLKMAYKESIKDFPNPRLAMRMGNFLCHISCNIKACDGSSCTLSIYLQRNEKYSGCAINQESLRWKSSS